MWRILGGLLALVCTVPATAQEGRLERVRESLNHPADDKPAKKDKDKASDDDDANGLIGEVAILAFLAPFALPHLVLHDDLERSGYFPGFPYSRERPGYLTFADAEQDESRPLRTFSIRLSAEYGTDFKDIDRFGSRLILDTTSRFGLEASTDFIRERLPCGCYDALNLSTVNLTYRFAQSSHVEMHAGAGLNILDDGWGTHYGFNFLYGADIFPVKPIVASLLLEGGTIQDASLFRARGTIGVNYRNFEGFIGYDYLNIGGVDLQGPLVGLRLWF